MWLQGLLVVALVVAAAGGEKKEGIVKSGGGNLYSGHSVTGGNGGKSKPGMFPTSPNVGAKSFLLPPSTFSMLLTDKAMKIVIKTIKRRKEAI